MDGQHAPDQIPPSPAPSRHAREKIEDRFHHKPIIEKFPSVLAGAPVSKDRDETSEEQYCTNLAIGAEDEQANPYAPFQSKTDWEIAKWAKLRGAGSTAFTDLIQVEGVS